MLCATTGGLASPLLVTLGLMICVAVDVAAAPGVAAAADASSLLRVGFLAPGAPLAHRGRPARRAARARRTAGRASEHVCVALFAVDRHDDRHLPHGLDDDQRLRARRPRARRAARRALQRERGPHARARGHRRAPRARGEEPARGHQGPLDAHGAQRDRPEDRRAARDRRGRGRSPPVDRRRLPLVLARPRRSEGRARRGRTRSRASSASCSRRAPRTRASRIETDGDEALVLDADARKLRQALLNIVLNAIQASPRGLDASTIAVARDCEGATHHRPRRGHRDDARGPRSHPQAVLHDEGGRHRASGSPSRAGSSSSTAGSLEFESAPAHGDDGDDPPAA